jgi:hypothetical protein
MACGMRHHICCSPRSGTAKEEEKEGAACTAGKADLPMLASPVKPKMPRACEYVTAFCTLSTLAYMCPM